MAPILVELIAVAGAARRADECEADGVVVEFVRPFLTSVRMVAP